MFDDLSETLRMTILHSHKEGELVLSELELRCLDDSNDSVTPGASRDWQPNRWTSESGICNVLSAACQFQLGRVRTT